MNTASTGSVLIYGAYGYTGQLVSQTAITHGLDPILAGRDGDRLRKLGRERQCSVREFDLSIPEIVAESIRDVDVVCNCAGPFSRTTEPLVDACIEGQTDYLDVTGEWQVFEALAARHAEAVAADVTLLPGIGFDVVATDCLAAALHEQVPAATHLELGVDADMTVSRGTARTAVHGLGGGTVVREADALVTIPTGTRWQRINAGRGERDAVAVSLGDVVTAAWTTGIPNVTVYVTVPPRYIKPLSFARWAEPVFRTWPVRWLLDRIVQRHIDDPTPEERAHHTVCLWGRASIAADRDPTHDGTHNMDGNWNGMDESRDGTDESRDGTDTNEDSFGRQATMRLQTPDPYTVTARTAVDATERVLRGDAPAGFTTPAGAFGLSMIDIVDGVSWLES